MIDEAAIRPGLFFGILALMGVWDGWRRPLSVSQNRHWRANSGIICRRAAAVMTTTRERLREPGWSWREGETSHDIDRAADLAHLPQA